MPIIMWMVVMVMIMMFMGVVMFVWLLDGGMVIRIPAAASITHVVSFL